MTNSHHGQWYPLATHLRTVTAGAGYAIDTGELGPATGHHPDQVHAWIRAAARHAAATHMRHLLDDPIDFYREAAAEQPLDDISHDVDLLADLVRRRDTLIREQDQASVALLAACRELTGTGLLWPTDHQQHATDGQPTDGPHDELAATLVDIGFEPVAHTRPPTRAAYRHHHASQLIDVTVNDDRGVDVKGHDGDGTPVWVATFAPDTPIPVITAAVRAALHTETSQPPSPVTPIRSSGTVAPPDPDHPHPDPITEAPTGEAGPTPPPCHPAQQPPPDEQDAGPGSSATLNP